MKALLFLMLMSALPALAADPCGHNITLGNATIQIQNGLQVIAQSYTIKRTDPSNGRCTNYRLYFSKGIANSYSRQAQNSSGVQADYNLHPNFLMLGTLKDYNDANSGFEYIAASTPDENVNYSGTFYISVPGLSSQGSLPGGTYTDNIQIRVYSYANNGNLTLEEVQPFSINILVNVNMAVSIVDEGGAHNASSTSKVLNFGNLATNQEMGTDIMVSSNATYQLKFSSLNNGFMKRNATNLAYQLRVNNATYSLAGSSSTPVTVGSGAPNGSTPARFNVKIKITGATTNLPAGDYEDTITITAIAN